MRNDDFQSSLDKIISDKSGLRLGESINCLIHSLVALSQKSDNFIKLKDYNEILYERIVDETLISVIGALHLLAGYNEQEVNEIVDSLLFKREYDA